MVGGGWRNLCGVEEVFQGLAHIGERAELLN
jgi:hypothetical protein